MRRWLKIGGGVAVGVVSIVGFFILLVALVAFFMFAMWIGKRLGWVDLSLISPENIWAQVALFFSSPFALITLGTIFILLFILLLYWAVLLTLTVIMLYYRILQR